MIILSEGRRKVPSPNRWKIFAFWWPWPHGCSCVWPALFSGAHHQKWEVCNNRTGISRACAEGWEANNLNEVMIIRSCALYPLKPNYRNILQPAKLRRGSSSLGEYDYRCGNFFSDQQRSGPARKRCFRLTLSLVDQLMNEDTATNRLLWLMILKTDYEQLYSNQCQWSWESISILKDASTTLFMVSKEFPTVCCWYKTPRRWKPEGDPCALRLGRLMCPCRSLTSWTHTTPPCVVS